MKYSDYKLILPIIAACVVAAAFQSCSDNDVAPDPAAGLQLITEGYAPGAATRVQLLAAQDLFAGYNPVTIALYDSLSGERINDAHVSFSPLMDMGTMTHSCPVGNPGPEAVGTLFPGSILFTMPSGEAGGWTLGVTVHRHGINASGTALMAVNVKEATPARVISFAEDGVRYYLGYLFPERIKVGVNPFDVIVFVKEGEDYVPVEDLRIALHPEMPSMDHGSPNNEDPVYTGDGHYSGKVNFTMTGEWRLNLVLERGMRMPGTTKSFDVIVP